VTDQAEPLAGNGAGTVTSLAGMQHLAQLDVDTRELLSKPGALTQNLAARDQLIGDVIDNLNTVLVSADEKGAQFDACVDQLQQVITGLTQGRDPIAGAIGPLASAENNLTDMLQQSRRPLQGVIENVRPLAQRMDERKADINRVIEPLAENSLRLNALGAYGAFFNIYYCSIRMKINGPAGSDVLIPSAVRRIRPRGGARRIARPDGVNPLRTRIFGIVLVVCLVLVSFGRHPARRWLVNRYPIGAHHHPLYPQHRAAGPRTERRRAGQAEVRPGVAGAHRFTARRHPATARRPRRSNRVVPQPLRATRRWRSCRHTSKRCPTRWPSARIR
jgi:hypothetical protein